jgi:16S rRNA (cytidine1402-2'-O)-methyltransferase
MAVLKVLASPISGDYSQLPAYTLEEIKNADLIIGEERKITLRFLAAVGCREHEYRLLNEHSTDEEKTELMKDVSSCRTAILFSDAGTPCIADPGYDFVDMCIKAGMEIRTLNAVSAVTAAISVSGFYAETFLFAGFPPKDKADRLKFFNHMKNTKQTAVIFERPYALIRTLEELKGVGKKVSLSINISMSDEKNYRGTATDILNLLPEGIKAPFVIVIEGKK